MFTQLLGDTPAVKRLITIGALLFAPSTAFAAPQEQLFAANLLVIIILGISLAVVLGRVLKSRGWPSGLEFLALGYLVGPVLNLVHEDQLELRHVAEVVEVGAAGASFLGVILSILCAALGLIVAFSLDFRWFRDWELEASAEAVPILISVPVVLSGVLWWVYTMDFLSVEVLALLVGAAAVLVAVDLRPAHIFLTHFNVWGENRLFGLRLGTTLQAAAIIAAGVAFAILQNHHAGKPGLQAVVLLGIQALIAAGVGLVARSVSPLRARTAWTLSVSICAALFIGTFAPAMSASALLMGMVAGLVWVQFDRDLSTIHRDIEPVLHASIFVIAGLVWSSNPEPWVFAVVLGWLVVRWVVFRFYQNVFRRKKRPVYGLLWPAGVLGIAIVLELRLAYPPYEAEWSTGLLLAIVVSELVSRRLFRYAMIDQGTFQRGGT